MPDNFCCNLEKREPLQGFGLRLRPLTPKPDLMLVVSLAVLSGSPIPRIVSPLPMPSASVGWARISVAILNSRKALSRLGGGDGGFAFFIENNSADNTAVGAT